MALNPWQSLRRALTLSTDSPEEGAAVTSALPFVLEHRHEDEKPNGDFTPSAAVLLTPTLRESGLLMLLSPLQAQALWGVLSFVSPNGTFLVTPHALADLLWGESGVTQTWRAQRQLESLCELCWNGGAILHRQQTENGLLFYTPSIHLFTVRDFRPPEPTPTPVALAAPREVVIAHSRATYGNRREEVEARIHRFLTGQPTPEEEELLSPETRHRLELGRRLRAVGLNREQIHHLLERYPTERIEQQLGWLPQRGARNRAAYLLRAIEEDYAPPKTTEPSDPLEE